jgi:hypothetical protein
VAKRKLSAEQRVELRKALVQGLKAGRERGALVKETAGKYGITTVTAAWYLKSVGGKVKSRQDRPKGGSRKAKAGAAPERNGQVARLVELAESKAARASKRAREARRLVPRWRALVKKEQELRALESRVRQELSAVSRKTKGLGVRIHELVGT